MARFMSIAAIFSAASVVTVFAYLTVASADAYATGCPSLEYVLQSSLRGGA